jgi:hypothetical protein
MTIVPGDLFEVALIVPDLEKAMHEFHDAFGYTFSPILEGHLSLRDSEGNDDDPPLRMVVTREVEPQLELVEAQAGTVLEAAKGTGLHHLGYYVDDLVAASAGLTTLGMPLQAAGTAMGEAPDGWVYHRMGDGTVIELVARDRADLRRQWTAGSLPDSPLANRLVPAPQGLGGP